MEQYIPKAPVVAEIKGLIRANELYLSEPETDEIRFQKVGAYSVLNDLLHFLDTLEVKDIDLEDNIKETLAQNYVDYIFERHNIDPESKEGQLIYYAYIHGMNQYIDTFKT